MHGRWLAGIGAVSVVALAGCSESADVTLYKPGVYKGPVDPLVEKQRTPQQQAALQARFNQVQTDR